MTAAPHARFALPAGHRAAVLALGLLLLATPVPAEPLADAIVARVDGRVVTASEIALARALGVLGFVPTAAPVGRADVERMVDAILLVQEAERLGLSPDNEAVERAWAAATARAGGEAALEGWLADQAVPREWARRLVADEARRELLLEERFVVFTFVAEDEVDRALGPGSHDETARERVRDQLTQEAARRAQDAWLAEGRRRASIRIVLPAAATVPSPFPAPGAAR